MARLYQKEGPLTDEGSNVYKLVAEKLRPLVKELFKKDYDKTDLFRVITSGAVAEWTMATLDGFADSSKKMVKKAPARKAKK